MKKSGKKKAAVLFSALIILCLIVFVCIKAFSPLIKYNNASRLLQNGQYAEAAEIFESLGDYKDSGRLYTAALMADPQLMQVGAVISYGDYENEPIQWFVASVREDKVLLVSCNALTERRFDDDSNDWVTSEIRDWLNGEFYGNAFTEEEMGRIAVTEEGDKVFLLNRSEFTVLPDSVRSCNNGSGGAVWWLRSPGYVNINVTYVYSYGTVNVRGCDASKNTLGVRPAIWISLE